MTMVGLVPWYLNFPYRLRAQPFLRLWVWSPRNEVTYIKYLMMPGIK